MAVLVALALVVLVAAEVLVALLLPAAQELQDKEIQALKTKIVAPDTLEAVAAVQGLLGLLLVRSRKAVLVEQVLHHLYQEHKFSMLAVVVVGGTMVVILFL
jgi:hypothetical protein